MASVTGRGEHLTITADYNTGTVHVDVGLDHLVEVVELLELNPQIDTADVLYRLKRAILLLVKSDDDDLAADARMVLLHIQRLEAARAAKKKAEAESDD